MADKVYGSLLADFALQVCRLGGFSVDLIQSDIKNPAGAEKNKAVLESYCFDEGVLLAPGAADVVCEIVYSERDPWAPGQWDKTYRPLSPNAPVVWCEATEDAFKLFKKYADKRYCVDLDPAPLRHLAEACARLDGAAEMQSHHVAQAFGLSGPVYYLKARKV